ncbi:unnamed protein product, partial [Didymodactylos carnosus]
YDYYRDDRDDDDDLRSHS